MEIENDNELNSMSFPMKSKGEYYGYPECCIRAFHTFVMFRDISPERQRAAKNGFVPCQDCAEKILNGQRKLHELILPTRKCDKPFPNH